MLKFKVGDSVRITSGKDKGRQGKIEKVYPGTMAALIIGLNIYKRHIKPGFTKDAKGGIYEISRPISFAGLALICPNCKKVTRVAFRQEGDLKLRICKKCKVSVDLSKK